jgi:adenosylcobinamide-phosphate synthase
MGAPGVVTLDWSPAALAWSPAALAWSVVALACLLDRLLGDPPGWLHPVQVMGALIAGLRPIAEALCGPRPRALRLAGMLITLLVVGLSLVTGWALESLALGRPFGPFPLFTAPLPGALVSLAQLLAIPLLLLSLASALAGRSLEQAVQRVLEALPDPVSARARLAGIVGRDVTGLDQAEILRACAETASENGVDGLFAPLFWMVVGAGLWAAGTPGSLPGPLALAWAFKAASTLDSMLGYRRGSLRWLGTAGARLDDLLTWLPCRLVALSLPWVALPAAGLLPAGTLTPTGMASRNGRLFRQALRQGAADPSPNAGVSQAAYALVAGVRLGGVNRYGGQEKRKPLLAPSYPPPQLADVQVFLALNRRLQWAWLAAALPLLLAASLAPLPSGT